MLYYNINNCTQHTKQAKCSTTMLMTAGKNTTKAMCSIIMLMTGMQNIRQTVQLLDGSASVMTAAKMQNRQNAPL